MKTSRHSVTNSTRLSVCRCEDIGAPASGTIMGHLHQYGTECLIVDDALDLSAAASDVAQRSDGPGAALVRSSAWVVSGGCRARRHDSRCQETFDLPDPTSCATSVRKC